MGSTGEVAAHITGWGYVMTTTDDDALERIAAVIAAAEGTTSIIEGGIWVGGSHYPATITSGSHLRPVVIDDLSALVARLASVEAERDAARALLARLWCDGPDGLNDAATWVEGLPEGEQAALTAALTQGDR